MKGGGKDSAALLKVDSRAEPLDSLSGWHVQVTECPAGSHLFPLPTCTAIRSLSWLTARRRSHPAHNLPAAGGPNFFWEFYRRSEKLSATFHIRHITIYAILHASTLRLWIFGLKSWQFFCVIPCVGHDTTLTTWELSIALIQQVIMCTTCPQKSATDETTWTNKFLKVKDFSVFFRKKYNVFYAHLLTVC